MLYVVFEFCGEQYKISQYNHWTSPYLDHDVEAVREDNTLKHEIAELKSKYCFLVVAYVLHQMCCILFPLY